MKKLSITKKSKLAFGVGGVWYKFHILSLSMVLVNMMVFNRSGRFIIRLDGKRISDYECYFSCYEY